MNAIVLCHNGVAETVARHMPGWKATFSEIILISPSDDYLPGSLPLGLSSKAGRGNLERMMMAAVIASRFPAACVMEYDTAFFGVTIPNDARTENPIAPWVMGGLIERKPFPGDGKLVCSRVFKSDDPRFQAECYGHSPWIATGETWWKIATAGAANEYGVPDRWLALAAEIAGVQMLGINQAFSDDREWTPTTRIKAIYETRRGARIFHGIKTRYDFEVVQAAWKSLDRTNWSEQDAEEAKLK